MPIPDYSHYIVGYRAWFVEPDGYLRSVHNPYRWVPRKRNESSWVPQRTHREPYGTAGFYAFKDSDALRAECLFQMALTTSTSYAKVHGRVALWGQLVEHQNGYRAQYAYPLELYIDSHHPDQAKQLRELYGVPVTEQGHRINYVDGTVKKVGFFAWMMDRGPEVLLYAVIGQAIVQLLLFIFRLNWVHTSHPSLNHLLDLVVIP